MNSPSRLGWPAHHDEWLRAAISLPREAREAAFVDIGQMAERPLSAIQKRAYEFMAAQADYRIKTESERNKAQMEGIRARKLARAMERSRVACAMPPSQMPPVALSRLMGAK